MNYNKQPLTIDAQIKLLKSRGLKFQDEEKASHYLSNISYYRLRAYTYPFQDNSKTDHPFVSNIYFEDIIALYVFDRKLRLLVFDALEKIEIALRTKIVYEYALNHGSHWYENQSLYRNNGRFNKDINKVYEEVERSTETFIKHYKTKYSNPQNPACWMSLEVVSLGLLSKLFENLQNGTEKKGITSSFGLPKQIILESWMHSFAHLRNICAHHGRLWNRRFTTIPQIPYNTTFQFLNNTNIYPNKLYCIVSCISYVLQIINPGHSFNDRLKKLMAMNVKINLKDMGFPNDWLKEPLWK